MMHFAEKNVSIARLVNETEGRGAMVVLVCSDQQVLCYQGSQQTCTTFHPTSISAIGLAQNSSLLAVGCEGGSLWLWDSGKHVGTLPGHRTEITCIEFHPFGAFFASGSTDRNVKIWDTRQSKCVQTYRGHTAPIVSVQFSPHGRWLVSGDTEGVVLLWDLTTGKLLSTYKLSFSCACIAFHPNDFFLVAGTQAGLTVWSCEDPQKLSPVASNHEPGIRRVVFSPDGTGVFAMSENSIFGYSWDGKSRKLSELNERKTFSIGTLLDVSVDDSRSWRAIISDINGVRIEHYSEKQESKKVDKHEKSTEDSLAHNFEGLNHTNRVRNKSFISVLNARLMSVRTICGLWANGNSKLAINEAITLAGADTSVFVSLMIALPNTKTALSLDSCVKILKHIQVMLFANPEVNSFVISKLLHAIVFLSKRFESVLRDIQKAPPVLAGDFSRDDRTARGRACIALFCELEKQVQDSTKIGRKDKQETLHNIVLIQ